MVARALLLPGRCGCSHLAWWNRREQQLAASQVRCGDWGWLKPHCDPVAVCTVVLGGYVLTSDQQGTEPGHNSQRVSLCGRVRPACRDVHSVRWSGRTVPQRAVAQHGVACSAPSGTPWSSLRRGAVEASVLPCQQVTVFKRIIRTGGGRGRAPILYTKICTPNVYTSQKWVHQK